MPSASKDPLALPARRRIHDELQRSPGIHLRDLARRMGMRANHAKYHVLALARADLVACRRDGVYWRLWPRAPGPVGLQDTLVPEEKEAIALLHRRVAYEVAACLLAQPGVTRTELAHQLALPPSTLQYHLRRLEGAGVAASTRRGRTRQYRLARPEATRDALRRCGRAPADSG